MSKDNWYYLLRIQRACEDYWNSRTTGKPDEEIMKILEEIEGESSVDRAARIGFHLHEAFAIIQQLQNDPMPSDHDKVYELSWMPRVPKMHEEPRLMQSSMTRTEMLDRLHWISSEEFGEDLDEWADWMAAFEANPPAWGYR